MMVTVTSLQELLLPKFRPYTSTLAAAPLDPDRTSIDDIAGAWKAITNGAFKEDWPDTTNCNSAEEYNDETDTKSNKSSRSESREVMGMAMEDCTQADGRGVIGRSIRARLETSLPNPDPINFKPGIPPLDHMELETLNNSGFAYAALVRVFETD